MQISPKYSLTLVTLFISVYSSALARDLSTWKSHSDTTSVPAVQSVSLPPNLVKWPTFHGVQNTGEIKAVFDCFGNLGIKFTQAPTGEQFSFATPVDPPMEYLYGGAIWVGGIVSGDTLVSVGFDGWFTNAEFRPPQFPVKGSVTPFNYSADFSMRAEFTDTSKSDSSGYSSFDPLYHIPLNMKIANRSHAWHSSPEDGTIIYDMVITNIGTDTIQEGTVGIFIDADVGAGDNPHSDDLSGSIRNGGIAYIIDNDGDLRVGIQNVPAPKIFACKFLNNSFYAPDTNFSWWMPRGNSNSDFGPRLRPTPDDPFREFGTGGTGTPQGDKNKYYVMSHKEWDYDAVFVPIIETDDSIWLPPPPPPFEFGFSYDARFVLSLTPFRLEPDSSIRVLFATFTGDSVHTDPNNIDNLPLQPDIYLSNLNFDDLLVNTVVSDSLAQLLLNPHLPALGLEMVANPDGDPELQWDPWVYEDVTGYEIFLQEADLTQLPLPGAIPPWWAPSNLNNPVTVGRTHRLNIDWVESDKYYLAQIRHILDEDFGDNSEPINFRAGPIADAPQVPLGFVSAIPGQPIKLLWSNSGNPEPHHFVIYKFPDSVAARKAFHPLYDNGYKSLVTPPKDSFEVNGQSYYYYAMVPYAIVDGADSVFFDATYLEGETYVIAGADVYGFESQFSKRVTAFVGAERTREVLIITNSQVITPENYVFADSILSFYGQLLAGLDYDIYSIRDSLGGPPCYGYLWVCEVFGEFLPYKLVIYDDHLRAFQSDPYEPPGSALGRIFEKLLANGCKVAMLGPYYSGTLSPIRRDSIAYYPYSVSSANLFGASSTFNANHKYYYNNSTPPFIDSLFGFIKAEQADGTLPTVNFEVNRDPFQPRLRQFWPMITPPGVSTFVPSYEGEITHVYRSLVDSTSVQEGHAVGIRKKWPLLNTESYIFGFHLWNMDSADARDLVETILNSTPFAAGAKTTIKPLRFDLEESDTTPANIYLGELELGYQISDLDVNSLKLNYLLTPSVSEILISHPGYSGEVLKIGIDRQEILNYYGPVWDSQFVGYTISGLLQDDSEFRARGTFTIHGYTLGDLDNNDWISIFDINILVGYLFRNHSAPNPTLLADINMDGIADIQDVLLLVNHVFKGIPL